MKAQKLSETFATETTMKTQQLPEKVVEEFAAADTGGPYQNGYTRSLEDNLSGELSQYRGEPKADSVLRVITSGAGAKLVVPE